MKKYNYFLTALVVSLLTLSACGNTNEKKETDSSLEKGLVLTAASEADFDETANSIDDLTDASDFVAEVKVTRTDAYVYPDTDMIYTIITPEILTLYKGSYQGENLHLCGGHMSYAEYYSAPIFQEENWHTFDTSAYTKDELKQAQVYWNWCNNYVPSEGDTLLFFGIRDENGDYQMTYSYQGMFRLEGDRWTNQALIVNKNGWQEPLAADLLSLSGAEAAAPDDADTFTSDGITYNKPQSTYDTVVSVPKETLAALIDETCA